MRVGLTGRSCGDPSRLLGEKNREGADEQTGIALHLFVP